MNVSTTWLLNYLDPNNRFPGAQQLICRPYHTYTYGVEVIGEFWLLAGTFVDNYKWLDIICVARGQTKHCSAANRRGVHCPFFGGDRDLGGLWPSTWGCLFVTIIPIISCYTPIKKRKIGIVNSAKLFEPLCSQVTCPLLVPIFELGLFLLPIFFQI